MGTYRKNMLRRLPREIIHRMFDEQSRQGNRHEPRVFEENLQAGVREGGFDWSNTREGFTFWARVLGGEYELFRRERGCAPRMSHRPEPRIEFRTRDSHIADAARFHHNLHIDAKDFFAADLSIPKQNKKPEVIWFRDYN